MFQFLITYGLLIEDLIWYVESYLLFPYPIDYITEYDQFICPDTYHPPSKGKLYQQIVEIDKHMRFNNLIQWLSSNNFNHDEKKNCINCLYYASEDWMTFYICEKRKHSFCYNCIGRLGYRHCNYKLVPTHQCVGCWYEDIAQKK
jgi:hypothetical protein